MSGHPLDGIGEFIRAKSKNLGAVLEFFEEDTEIITTTPQVISSEILSDSSSEDIPLETREEDVRSDGDAPQAVVPPETDVLEENIYAQLIGVVSEVRKMQTKS